MKRIVFVSSVDIHLKNGGGLATRAYYNAFLKLYPNLVDLFIPEESISSKSSDNNIYGIKKRNKLLTPFYLLFGKLHRVKKTLLPYLKNNYKKYDICVINGGVIAGDMIKYIKSIGIKVVVIHHNYEKEYHVDNKSVLSFFGLFSYYIIRNEKKAYKYADLNLFITESDFKDFKIHYGESFGESAIISCFEYENSRKQDIENIYDINKIAISGAMNCFQTIKGIEEFRKKYFNLTKDIIPNLEIIITGRNPSKSIYNFKNKYPNTIHIVANPKNICKVIENAGIFYCPTSIGSGLKLRLMDGLKQGMPVLVHSKSAKGYEVFQNKNYFKIYNTKETFIRSLTELYLQLKENKINKLKIQNDYYSNFGFESGVKRLKIILSESNLINQ